MDRAQTHAATRLERERLVDDLSSLSADDWEMPSLCDGWSVRDVVGHLIRIDEFYRTGWPVVADGMRAGLRINKGIADGGRRRARGRSPQELVDSFSRTAYEERFVMRFYPWPAIPLAEVVIHGSDIRRPLGIGRMFPAATLAAVAELSLGRLPYPWGRGWRGQIRAEATDADWRSGNGALVRGPMEAIVLALAGRRVALAELEGEGLDILAK